MTPGALALLVCLGTGVGVWLLSYIVEALRLVPPTPTTLRWPPPAHRPRGGHQPLSLCTAPELAHSSPALRLLLLSARSRTRPPRPGPAHAQPLTCAQITLQVGYYSAPLTRLTSIGTSTPSPGTRLARGCGCCARSVPSIRTTSCIPSSCRPHSE